MGKFTAYKVQLAQLKDGHHEQDFVIDTDFFKNMERTDIHKADVKVHLDLEKKHDVYDCTFHCQGVVEVACDRCLDPLEIEIDTTYHIIVKYGEEYNDESDDILVIPESNTYLNVAYMLYDTVVLCIPLRHVHPIGKCNRAMLTALSKHRSAGADGDEADDQADYADTVEVDPSVPGADD
ncbi:MAG: DUF177 domain-containing protein [Muribaculaceae bacterium]|nr:DUF177 domain-containing protein [Muribaculaceae bacterium]MDE5957995.1 DUF177 domain-containing protein [Muribaculaceae bacterium]MDE6447305.1 DUF177 domain-containing protein [Muribaculaceae bacterium]MDE7342515.1 DUF177 domain-containing protein [Muribaculaceae bacterium]